MEIILGTQTISGMQTMTGMETTVCAVTGRNTSSPIIQAIGIAIGTTAIIGGTVTGAALSTDRG